MLHVNSFYISFTDLRKLESAIRITCLLRENPGTYLRTKIDDFSEQEIDEGINAQPYIVMVQGTNLLFHCISCSGDILLLIICFGRDIF